MPNPAFKRLLCSTAASNGAGNGLDGNDEIDRNSPPLNDEIRNILKIMGNGESHSPTAKTPTNPMSENNVGLPTASDIENVAALHG